MPEKPDQPQPPHFTSKKARSEALLRVPRATNEYLHQQREIVRWMAEMRGLREGEFTDSVLKMVLNWGDEIFEDLLFRSLLPTFDDVPFRRVLPLVLYRSVGDATVFPSDTIERLGYELVNSYSVLSGSHLSRDLYRGKTRQTYMECENEQIETIEQIARGLRKSGVAVTVNVYFSPSTQEPPKQEEKEWTDHLKDFTEALKNILLIGAGGALLFGGIFIKSDRGMEPHKHDVTLTHLDRDGQLKALPKILDATTPEDFEEVLKLIPPPPGTTTHP